MAVILYHLQTIPGADHASSDGILSPCGVHRQVPAPPTSRLVRGLALWVGATILARSSCQNAVLGVL